MILYDIEPTNNKRLLFLRELNAHNQHVGNMVWVTPETLEQQYSIDLQTIQSVLADLEERGHIEIEQVPNHNLTHAQRVRKDDEQDYYLIILNDSFTAYYDILEQTESFHRADTASTPTNHPGLMTATLSFESITTPVISIGNDKYRFPSMREGLPFNIISHCLATHPGHDVKLDTLKSELNASNMKSYGLNNLRENIRNSYFGGKNPLSPFVIASPRGILVRHSTTLTRQQLDAIKAASK